MPSNRFPGVEALEAFLRHHLAATPLADLSPFEYALQYLELPLDEDHDIEETYELFWGVCCLEDEFHAFQNKKQNRRSEKKQASIAAAVPLPEETDPEPNYAHREIAPPHQKHRSELVNPIAPAFQAQTAAATLVPFANDAKLGHPTHRSPHALCSAVRTSKSASSATAPLSVHSPARSHTVVSHSRSRLPHSTRALPAVAFPLPPPGPLACSWPLPAANFFRCSALFGRRAFNPLYFSFLSAPPFFFSSLIATFAQRHPFALFKDMNI